MRTIVTSILLLAIFGTTLSSQDVLLLIEDDAFTAPMQELVSVADSSETTLLDRFQTSVTHGDLLLSLLLALFAGFLTSLSPCIYPLIPITLSVMGTRRYESHLQGFLVSLAYVGGMAVLYTALGATFASLGLMLGTLMQHPAVLIGMAVFFGIMAMSMLGFFTIVVPQRILTKLTSIGGNGVKGAFLMGLVAGVLAAPCTGPVLGVILTLIAGAKDVLMGSFLMLAFSFGIGIPFLILGTFSSTIARLPKSGSWMDNIKYIFGALMLGAAFYYAALALPMVKDLITHLKRLGLPSTLLLIALSLGLLLVHAKSTRTFLRSLQTSVGAILFALLLASILLPDHGAQPLAQLQNDNLTWHVIDATTNDHTAFDRLVTDAREQQRPMLVDFYADWCTACVQFDQITFKDPDVAAVLEQFLLVRIDSTKSSDYLVDLQNRFKVIGLPLIVIIDAQGGSERIQGFLDAKRFLPLIKRAEKKKVLHGGNLSHAKTK